MPKRITFLLFFAVLFTAGNLLSAQESSRLYGDSVYTDNVSPAGAAEIRWYRSNSSGLALELISSRLAALRYEYCLSVERKYRWELPAFLAPYYDDFFLIELRTLFEKGEVFRYQWIFRDAPGTVRLTAAGTVRLFSEEEPVNKESPNDESDSEADEGKRSGFLEIMDSDGAITREIRFEEDSSEWEFLFFYDSNVLTRAETLFRPPRDNSPEEETQASAEEADTGEAADEPDTDVPRIARGDARTSSGFVPVSTDYYRYTRAGSLRAVDRVLHEGAGTASRITFPRIGPDVPYDEGLSIRAMSYTSEFLADIRSPEGASITYSMDSRGRILSEVWKNSDGEILGELRNTWADDRLQTVLWKSPDEERRVEYEYDSGGNRTAERNFRQDVLERSVSVMGDVEVEEIYMNGRVILRAYWEKGLKISEERVSPPASSPGRRQ